ncbi:MAG TPA: hypothetical protein VLV28_07615 [Gaiellaceae bacterium]|nr:hypothetical protein [Gaiellaceae bacterium]
MYATLRWYGGNVELADQLASRADEIKAVIGPVQGLRGYYLIRTDGGTVSITVADDRSGAEESNSVAADWIRENMPEVAASPPQISMGEVVLSL